jgi:hypothetical protein
MVAPIMRTVGPPDLKVRTMAMPHVMFYAPHVTNEDIGAVRADVTVLSDNWDDHFNSLAIGFSPTASTRTARAFWIYGDFCGGLYLELGCTHIPYRTDRCDF